MSETGHAAVSRTKLSRLLAVHRGAGVALGVVEAGDSQQRGGLVQVRQRREALSRLDQGSAHIPRVAATFRAVTNTGLDLSSPTLACGHPRAAALL
jgi:hypothetical protein